MDWENGRRLEIQPAGKRVRQVHKRPTNPNQLNLDWRSRWLKPLYRSLSLKNHPKKRVAYIPPGPVHLMAGGKGDTKHPCVVYPAELSLLYRLAFATDELAELGEDRDHYPNDALSLISNRFMDVLEDIRLREVPCENEEQADEVAKVLEESGAEEIMKRAGVRL